MLTRREAECVGRGWWVVMVQARICLGNQCPSMQPPWEEFSAAKFLPPQSNHRIALKSWGQGVPCSTRCSRTPEESLGSFPWHCRGTPSTSRQLSVKLESSQAW